MEGTNAGVGDAAVGGAHEVPTSGGGAVATGDATASAASGGAGGGAGGAPSDQGNPLYLKASNTGAGDLFGVSLAFSADGGWLAVGANREASAATGIDGDQEDESAIDSGAVYLFARDGDGFMQAAYVKASNTGSGDAFGSAVALAADGSTLVVGAPFEASSARGIDGEQIDDSEERQGAVYVFARSGSAFEQQAYLKASNGDADDLFGAAVALSSDGNRLAVGADGEDGSALGVDGSETLKAARESGAVYVFERSDGTWRQAAYLKASNADARDHFGGSVAVSADGNTLAVGAFFEDGAGTSILDQGDDSAEAAGAAYVFVHDGTSWRQQAYVKPRENDGGSYDAFGGSVALSADGNTLAVGAAGDDSAATGIDGDPNDQSMPYSGAAYVFVRDATVWGQAAYLKASNASADDEFGHHLALSADGQTLAVGAAREASSTASAAGSAPESGAVYVFQRDGATFYQQNFLKAFDASAGDRFGWSLAFSGDAESLAVGASREASASRGVAGDPSDATAAQAGAVYVYDVAFRGAPTHR